MGMLCLDFIYSDPSLLTPQIDAHMLSDHVPEPAVELLVASVFLHPGPYAPPVSVHVGFLRFLRLLARFDWLNEPLIVNLPGTNGCLFPLPQDPLRDDDRSALLKLFAGDRSKLPVMFIATSMVR